MKDLRLNLPEVQCLIVAAQVVGCGERRLEGEFYLTGGYAVRLQFEGSSHPRSTMADLADVWMPHRLKGIQVVSEWGIPFLTATQPFDIRPTARKWLAKGRVPGIDSFYVSKGWILVTRSGNVGDAVLAYSPHFKKIISDDLLRVIPREQTLAGYLYCFLRTKYARAMMRSTRYGSIIKHLEPEHLQALPCLEPPPHLSKNLNRLMGRVTRFRDRAFFSSHTSGECLRGSILTWKEL